VKIRLHFKIQIKEYNRIKRKVEWAKSQIKQRFAVLADNNLMFE